MTQARKSVLVLHEALDAGARADELDALVQLEQVSTALKARGWDVSSLATGLDLAATLATIKKQAPDCVFNLVESLDGDGRMIHFIPALLSTAGVGFTGCNSDAMYLSSQKLLAKRWMHLHGIATPRILTGKGEQDKNALDDCDVRWIVKSVWEHASFGMDDGCVVNGVDAARVRMEESRRRYGGEWFAEEFIDGREFNISAMEIAGKLKVLPAAEMTFVDFPADKPRFVGYAAKWDENAPEYHATQRQFPALPDQLADALKVTVEQCWECFDLGGYARVDFRVDTNGKPWVLEINSNPCIAQDAGFAAAALKAGIGYTDLIEQLLRNGLPITQEI